MRLPTTTNRLLSVLLLMITVAGLLSANGAGEGKLDAEMDYQYRSVNRFEIELSDYDDRISELTVTAYYVPTNLLQEHFLAGKHLDDLRSPMFVYSDKAEIRQASFKVDVSAPYRKEIFSWQMMRRIRENEGPGDYVIIGFGLNAQVNENGRKVAAGNYDVLITREIESDIYQYTSERYDPDFRDEAVQDENFARRPPPGWESDFASAVSKARETDQNILVLFYDGWSEESHYLETRILAHREFSEWAGDSVVPLFMDMSQGESTTVASTELAAVLGVETHPTIFLLSPDLKPLLVTGYFYSDVDTYIRHLAYDRPLWPVESVNELQEKLGEHLESTSQVSRYGGRGTTR